MTITIGGRECVRGIDVSMYQSSIDWNVVAQNRQFAYVKAAEGSGYTDPWFTRHRDNARQANLPLGSYHYLQTGDGKAQAQHFLSVTNNYDGFQLPVGVDYEQSGDTAKIANDFIAEIERVVGKKWVGPTGQGVACIVYTGNYFNPKDRGPWSYMDLWLAAYTNPKYPNPGPEPDHLSVPGASAPWSQWTIWQCNGGDGRCPGVGNGNGQCDQNVATKEWFDRTLGNNPQPPSGDWLDMATAQEVEDIVRKVVQEENGNQNLTIGNALGIHLGDPSQLSIRHLLERVRNGVGAVVVHTGSDTDQPLPDIKVMD